LKLFVLVEVVHHKKGLKKEKDEQKSKKQTHTLINRLLFLLRVFWFNMPLLSLLFVVEV
jgi:hypothetical protein